MKCLLHLMIVCHLSDQLLVNVKFMIMRTNIKVVLMLVMMVVLIYEDGVTWCR